MKTNVALVSVASPRVPLLSSDFSLPLLLSLPPRILYPYTLSLLAVSISSVRVIYGSPHQKNPINMKSAFLGLLVGEWRERIGFHLDSLRDSMQLSRQF